MVSILFSLFAIIFAYFCLWPDSEYVTEAIEVITKSSGHF
jgi:hypothetical protein